MEQINKKKLRKCPGNKEKTINYLNKVIQYGRRMSALNTFEKMSAEIIKVSADVLTEDEIFAFLLQAEAEFK